MLGLAIVISERTSDQFTRSSGGDSLRFEKPKAFKFKDTTYHEAIPGRACVLRFHGFVVLVCVVTLFPV